MEEIHLENELQEMKSFILMAFMSLIVGFGIDTQS